MSKSTITVKSFRDLALVVQQQDQQKAAQLRKSAPLRKGRKTGKGPAVAR